MAFYVYLLASKKHGTLYIGVTNDVVGEFTNTGPRQSAVLRRVTA